MKKYLDAIHQVYEEDVPEWMKSIYRAILITFIILLIYFLYWASMPYLNF